LNQRIDEAEILKAAADIIVSEGKIVLVFTENSVTVKLPTTRRLAEHFDVQNYYILPFFTLMEENGLIKRIEREGIFTTEKGSDALFNVLRERHEAQTVKMLGRPVLDSLLKRLSS
jgi:DNA-binding transcriptional regulator YhcF (GntR family)